MTLFHCRLVCLWFAMWAAGALHAFTLDGRKWPDGTIDVDLHLGAPVAPLSDGSVSFDDVATQAMSDWNRYLGPVEFRVVPGSTPKLGDGRNSVVWSGSALGYNCGPYVLGITYSFYIAGQKTEADVVLNSAQAWDSYRGPLKTNVCDIRRVLTHELGHVLGLAHTDVATEQMPDLMDYQIGDTDTITADDVDGICAMYPPIAPTQSQLSNLSIRAQSGASSDPLIVGFVGASEQKQILVRAVGPTLAEFGIGDALPSPSVSLMHGQLPVIPRESWTDAADSGVIAAAAARCGAFPIPLGSKDAAMVANVSGDAYSAVVTDASGSSGIVLAEVYNCDASPAHGLRNVSARAIVRPGDGALIAGFAITGTYPKTILLRAVGPALRGFGISNPLAHPTLTLYSGARPLLTAGNWSATPGSDMVSSAATAVGAFPLTADSSDAAVVVRLLPGTYSIVVSSGDGQAGCALAEVYEVPSTTP